MTPARIFAGTSKLKPLFQDINHGSFGADDDDNTQLSIELPKTTVLDEEATQDIFEIGKEREFPIASGYNVKRKFSFETLSEPTAADSAIPSKLARHSSTRNKTVSDYHADYDQSVAHCIEESEQIICSFPPPSNTEPNSAVLPSTGSARRCILFTGIDVNLPEYHSVFLDFFKTFEDWKPVLEMTDEVTHTVTADDNDLLAAHRTFKFLESILLGRWIVSFNWMKDSLAAGRVLKEERYEIQGYDKNY